MSRKLSASAAIVIALWLTNAALASALQPIATTAFLQTWGRTDQPVAAGQVNRTWMWGPGATSMLLYEPYADAPGGKRLVQYFDKSRMEDNSYNNSSSPWNVTNGLLAKELITGQLQLGNNTFEQHDPAQINVAGDANDPNGPTYATFNPLMAYSAVPNGWTITQTVDRAGTVGSDQQLSSYGIIAQDVGAPTHHNVASVFWSFMNSDGPVMAYPNGSMAGAYTTTGKLFSNPFYATGYPLTEAYWTHVLVGGVSKLVLVQVFERRVLTYTPSNPDGWKVEAGNVGQHYYTWRYDQLGKTPVIAPNPAASAVVVQDPPPTTTTIGSVTLQHANVKFYEVTGTTASQLQSSMVNQGPTGSDGTHFDAYTTWQFHWTWSETTDNHGTCHPSNVHVTFSITITFPHWSAPANVDPNLVSRWTQFTEALATHEDGHAVRVISGANGVGSAIASAACGQESSAGRTALAAIQQASDQYDAVTQHGATQGAVWP